MLLISSVVLFIFILLLLLCYHFFVWNHMGVISLGFRSWFSSFECGFCSFGSSECYFSYTYFVLLVFFVVFDLEVSLLLNIPYAFNVFYNSLFYLAFLVVLGFGYGAELYSGYVRWAY